MTTNVQSTEGGIANLAKLIVAIAVLVAAVFGFYYYVDVSKAVRVVGLVVALAASIGLMAITAQGRMARSYLNEAHFEMRKVVWPTRQETMQTTLVIMGVVMIISIILWLIDMLLGWAILEHLLKSAG